MKSFQVTFVISVVVTALFSCALAQPNAQGTTALVRVAHLSPNAEQVSVSLSDTAGGQQLSPGPLSNLSYRDVTDYLQVPAGRYDVAVQTQAGTLQSTVTFNPSVRYTVAAVGLVIPQELGQQADDNGGFFNFLNNLFTNEDNRSALALRLLTFEDEVIAGATGVGIGTVTPNAPLTPANPGAARVGAPSGGAGVAGQTQQIYFRLVHAAPGTTPVALEPASAGDQEPTPLINDLSFGEVSTPVPLTQADANSLEVSLQSSEAGALTLGLSDSSFEPGNFYTLFVIGTPTNEAPLEVLTVSSPVVSPAVGGAVSGGAMSGGMMSGGAGQASTGAGTTTQLQDVQGNTVGDATFTPTPDGLQVQVNLTGFAAASQGEHGLHIHQVGQCEPPFESAGDHFNPTGAEHGFLSPNGPHVGDLPNIQVDADGNASYTVTTGLVTLAQGQRSLNDQDGSALILHSGPDDYHTNPSGNSGDRIACGVITQGQGGGQ